MRKGTMLCARKLGKTEHGIMILGNLNKLWLRHYIVYWVLPLLVWLFPNAGSITLSASFALWLHLLSHAKMWNSHLRTFSELQGSLGNFSSSTNPSTSLFHPLEEHFGNGWKGHKPFSHEWMSQQWYFPNARIVSQYTAGTLPAWLAFYLWTHKWCFCMSIKAFENEPFPWYSWSFFPCALPTCPPQNITFDSWL